MISAVSLPKALEPAYNCASSASCSVQGCMAYLVSLGLTAILTLYWHLRWTCLFGWLFALLDSHPRTFRFFIRTSDLSIAASLIKINIISIVKKIIATKVVHGEIWSLVREGGTVFLAHFIAATGGRKLPIPFARNKMAKKPYPPSRRSGLTFTCGDSVRYTFGTTTTSIDLVMNRPPLTRFTILIYGISFSHSYF